MKKSIRISLLFAVMMVLGLGSCSKSNGDKEQLLSRIPADAGYVALVDVEEIAKNAGCSFDGEKIVFSPSMEKLILEDGNSTTEKAVARLKDGTFGADFRVVAAFMTSDNIYFSGRVTNIEQFVESTSSETSPLEKQGKYYVGKGIAASDDMFWISDHINVADIERFMNLSEKESIMGSKLSNLVLEDGKALAGVGEISSFFRMMSQISGVSSKEIAGLRMALSMIFEDAQYSTSYVSLSGNTLKGEGAVLNGDYEPAKLTMEAGTIDGSTVKSLEGNGNVVIALALSKKMMEQLTQLAEGFGAQGAMISPLLKPINGTLAVEVDVQNESVAAALDVEGNTDTMVEMLGQFLNSAGVSLDRQGNRLQARRGAPVHGVSASEAAGEMKNYVFSMVFDTENLPAKYDMPPVKGFMGIKKDGKSIEQKIEVSVPEGNNFIEYFVKYLNK